MRVKNALTTGEIASYCAVNLKTVLRWIERGELNAYKLPGDRGDNRIEIAQFIAFLQNNHMPVPKELQHTPKRILIVDDEKKVAEAIKRALHLKGFEIAVALDGFQAGLLLESFKPALMTLDLQMPGMSGLAVIKHIRGNQEFTKIRILVISAMDKAQRDEAIQNGADDVLQKGFKNAELMEKIDKLLK